MQHTSKLLITTDRPTVILAKTVKGYAFSAIEGQNPRPQCEEA